MVPEYTEVNYLQLSIAPIVKVYCVFFMLFSCI
jgi:hypothetical protein